MATVIANTSPFWGMVIYERTSDGTLSGTWKNNGLSNDSILNEIARKRDDNLEIEGEYTISWIEENNVAHNGTLIVALIEHDTAFSFIWQNEHGVEVFRGMGMPIGLGRIAVTYWDGGGALRLSF